MNTMRASRMSRTGIRSTGRPSLFSGNLLASMLTLVLLMLSGAGALLAQTVTATLGVGSQPYAVAVNPVTNKIYVANMNSNNVTVIDGASNTTTTVSVGSGPQAVAVNPATNQIYVANMTATT